MVTLVRGSVCSVLIAAICVTLAPTNCQAASFWDWLWGQSPYYRPNELFLGMPASRAPATPAVVYPTASYPTASYPTASVPAATLPSACAPAAAADPCQPVISMPPATAGYTAGYGSTPWFRSTWARVPVTTYRPVAVVDPTTGAAVSQLQPCNGYTWQMRRVPTSVFRPLTGWFAGPPAVAAPAAAAPCAGSIPTGSVMAPAATAPANTGPATVPYYVPPTAAPSSSTTIPNSSIVPSPVPSTGSPADQAPSLRPGEASPQAAAPRPSLPGAGSTSTARPVTDVVPIPDPERRGSEPEGAAPHAPGMNSIPQLLDPENHTAANMPAGWQVLPTAWPASSDSAAVSQAGPSLHDARTGNQLSTQPRPAPWSDGGWSAAAR